MLKIKIMINYYLRNNETFIKVDNTSQEVTLVLNLSVQKTISKINNPSYYNNLMEMVSGWTLSNQVVFETNRSQVLAELNN